MRTIDEALSTYDQEKHCNKCGGLLIRSEKRYGSCGHCGGRSLRPMEKPQAATKENHRWWNWK